MATSIRGLCRSHSRNFATVTLLGCSFDLSAKWRAQQMLTDNNASSSFVLMNLLLLDKVKVFVDGLVLVCIVGTPLRGNSIPSLTRTINLS